MVLVVCTFLNAEDTLQDTLDSLSRQTFRNWTCVLVDDRSTDRSRGLAAAMASADPRFTLIGHGAGRGAALNAGAAHSEAEHIAILDADDAAHPDWLAIASRAADANDRLAAIGVDSVPFTDVLPSLQPDPAAGSGHPVCSDVTLRLCRLNPIGHSGALIRRRAFAAVGGYDATRVSQFDYDLWVRLALAGGRIGRLHQALIARRAHPGQKFKRTGHVRYVLRSVAVQSRAIAGLDPRLTNWAWLGARVAWGFVPRSVRASVRTRLRHVDHVDHVDRAG